jgi:membrane protease YdiL (CAAX protease family)
MSRKRSRGKSQHTFDTLLAFLIWAGLSIATFTAESEARQVMLWCGLLIISLIYTHRLRVELHHPFSALGRGAAAGFIISLPVLLLFQPDLSVILDRLLPGQSYPALFQSMVLISPFVEEIFFRGLLQKQHGLVAASLAYGAFLALFFLPGLIDFAIIAAAVAVTGLLLGFIYGYVNERYGLTAAMSCHLTVNLVIFFLPVVVPELSRLLMRLG